jgi:processing peptidase subunit alpha
MQAIIRSTPTMATARIARAASAQAMSVFDELKVSLPDLKPANAGPTPKAEVTTLSNGIRVVTVDDGSHVASVGSFVEAGTRHEVGGVEGAANMLKHSTFKSTTERSALRLYRDMEDAGIVSSTSLDREHLVYRADCLRDNALVALNIVAETMTKPYLPVYELLESRNLVAAEESDKQGNGQAILNDMVHATAYGKRGALGISDGATSQMAASVDADAIRNYHSATFTGERIVIAATGVDHDAFVRSAESLFSGLPSGAGTTSSAQYTGGEKHVYAASDAVHVALAFDTGAGGFKGNASEKSILSSLALETMLGGGVSNINARLSSVVTEDRFGSGAGASSFGSTYADAGLVGVFGTSSSSSATALVGALCNELKKAANEVATAQELSRAKNQLKATVALNLSTRGGIFSDLGTQVLSTGGVQSAEELFAKIDALTAADVQSAAKIALASKPTVVALGDCDNVPSYSSIEAMLK